MPVPPSARRRDSVRKLAATGILAAVSAVLMYLEFPVPLVPSFLKFDFSDLPALIAAFGVGPLSGVAVELLKNLLHLPVTATGGVGELANFLLGACLVLPAGLVYRIRKGRAGAFSGALAGVLLMSAVSLPINLFLTYPAYAKFLPMEVILSLYREICPAATTLPRALLLFNLPFTAAKGLVSLGIVVLAYRYLSPLLSGEPRARRRPPAQEEHRL